MSLAPTRRWKSCQFSFMPGHRDNLPHQIGRGLAGILQDDDVIAQDFPVAGGRHLLHDFAGHVFFGSGDPENPAPVQVAQMAEIDATLVKQDDFAALDPGADLARASVIVLAGGADNHKAGQQTLQVQAHMRFGGRLPAAVLRPVHVVGHQFEHGGVHHVDRHLEAKGAPALASGDELRRELSQMVERAPNNCSAISAGRSRLALDRPLRLGGVAPTVESGPECNWSESHRSFKPMLWESCACRRLTTWLQVEKVRALSSAPVLRPMRVTSPRGINLQICR